MEEHILIGSTLNDIIRICYKLCPVWLENYLTYINSLTTQVDKLQAQKKNMTFYFLLGLSTRRSPSCSQVPTTAFPLGAIISAESPTFLSSQTSYASGGGP